LLRVKSRSSAGVFGVVRPVISCVVAIAVVALAMALKGWQTASFLLGVMVVLLSFMLVYQVHRAVSRLRDQSAAVHAGALEAEEHYADVLSRMVHFAEARDPYLEGHSRRIGDLSRKMALRLGMPQEKADLLALAGELHDVGLLAVPASTLGQQRRISTESFRSVKEHCRIGYEILKPLSTLQEALLAVRHHHERMNGTGYPDGLSGDAIPVEARVLAVADVYDAMTHDRPHRPAIAPADALAEIRRCSPAGYDPACVDALAEILRESFLVESVAAQDGARSEG
jgi:HD-GYP domain-containing protein (c-di-GMP phosphodiesterase class II)